MHVSLRGQLNDSAAYPLGKSPLYPSNRAGLNYVQKIKFMTLPGLEHRPLMHVAQSLYRLRYRDSVPK
jgi:hypothetical protein